MKKYVIDKILELSFGLGIIVGTFIPGVFGPKTAMGVRMISLLVFGLFTRRVLVLPLDLIAGKKRELLYFSTVNLISQYEFFRKLFCCSWRFYRRNEAIDLLVPASLPKEQILSMECPQKDEKVEVTYYRFSGILLAWEKTVW